MKCQEAEGHLDAYGSGGLSPALRREIKAHLKGCAKCRARLGAMKEASPPSAGAEAPSEGDEIFPATSPPEQPPPAVSAPSASPVGRKEFVGLVVIMAVIGAGIYLYNQSSVDSKPLSSANEAAPGAVQPSPETGGSSGAPPGVVPPASPGAPSNAPLPMKLHRETTQALSNEAQRRARLATAPTQVKIVIVSRDPNEAADLVEARAVESEGRLLKRKKGGMETRLILLLPARRYDAFFQSLQALGPAKELSKKKPVLEDPLKIEVTVE